MVGPVWTDHQNAWSGPHGARTQIRKATRNDVPPALRGADARLGLFTM